MNKYDKQIESISKRLGASTVTTESGCIEWTGCKTQGGYGVLGSTIEGRTSILAHRAAWLVKYGAIPAGLLVCHSCDNPSCVNPQHMWLGTAQENNRDMLLKGRSNYRLPTSVTISLANRQVGDIVRALTLCNLTENELDEIQDLIATIQQ